MTAPRGDGSLEILMVRHAHAEWVPDEERPLSPRGRRQAAVVARLLEPRRPEIVYSSPYPRSVQTVEPLAEALEVPIELVEGLRERTLAEGPVVDFEAAMRQSWDDFACCFPGGETSAAAQERVWAAFQALLARHDRGVIAAGTHGNILALLMNRIDPAHDYEFWCSLSWPDVYVLTVEDGRVRDIERLWDAAVTAELGGGEDE